MKYETLRVVLRFALIAAAVAAAAGIGWYLAVKPRCATGGWLGAGVAAAAIYSYGWRAWPAVFVGSFAWYSYKLLMYPHAIFDDGLDYAAFLAVGQVLHALCTTAVLGGPTQGGLSSGAYLQRLLFRAAPSAALLSALIGGLGLIVFRSVEWSELPVRMAVMGTSQWFGVALVLPLFATFLHTKQWRSRRAYLLGVALPISLVLSASMLGVYVFRHNEALKYKEQFVQQTQQLQRVLNEELDEDLGLLKNLQQFYRGSNEVTQEEFAAFTADYLGKRESVSALAWAPFLRQAKQVPVTFIEPMGANRQILGLDLLSDPARKRDLELARDAAELRATPPVELPRRDGTRAIATLVLLPIYANRTEVQSVEQRRSALIGYVVVVIELDRLIDMSWRGWKSSAMQVRVTDQTDLEQEVLVYGSIDQPRAANSFNRFQRSLELRLAQRKLQLDFAATPVFAGNQSIWTSTVMLLGSLLLGALLVTLAVARWLERQHIKRDQRRLRHARDRVQSELSQLLSSMQEAVFIVDGDGYIVNLNAAASKLLQRSIASLRGAALNCYLPGYPCRHWDQQGQLETVLLAADGKEIPIELSRGAWDGEGSAYSLIFCRNISERKEQEARLAASYRQLQRSNRELEEFAYITSHDLKEPARGIGLNAQLILETVGDEVTPVTRKRLKRIVEATGHMAQLVDRVLHCARVSSAKLDLKPTKLQDVINYAVGSLQHCMDQKQAHLAIRDPLDYVLADAEMLSLVIRNLVSNALKYTDKAQPQLEIGCVDPEDASVPQELSQHIDLQQCCVVYVRDDGIGIDEEHLKHVFKLFKRLHHHDEYGAGHGAGLTVVKRVVQRHGGGIWVQSAPGEGSTFCFVLKRAAPRT